MMQKLVDLISSPEFYNFQQTLAESWYSKLVSGYKMGKREEEIVNMLVNAVNAIQNSGNSLYFGGMQVNVAAKFIHGNISQVKYKDFSGKEHQCELGDMVIIGAVAENRKLIFQRICFIQNKKGRNNKTAIAWGIDATQLFLLKHFPMLTGVSGILKGYGPMKFSNASGCLGGYGLLHSPGEMVFASAPLVDYWKAGRKSIGSKDMNLSPAHHCSHCGLGIAPLYFCKAWRSCLLLSLPYCHNRALFGNTIFARNVYEFITAWTHLSIGEILCCDGKIFNDEACKLATYMINSVLPGSIDESFDGVSANGFPEEMPGDDNAGMGVFVYLINYQ